MPRPLGLSRLILLIALGPANGSPGEDAALRQAREARAAGRYDQALAAFARLASAGNAEAQCRLGEMYAQGQGVRRSVPYAYQWFRKAADQGHAEAQVNVGSAYLKGLGVPKDETQAFKWYEKAARQGFPAGEFNLGAMYFFGTGVPKDLGEALQWYRRAAEQGLVQAQYQLGRVHLGGMGVPRDLKEARRWLSLAAQQGDPGARAALAHLAQLEAEPPRRKALRDWNERTTAELERFLPRPGRGLGERLPDDPPDFGRVERTDFSISQGLVYFPAHVRRDYRLASEAEPAAVRLRGRARKRRLYEEARPALLTFWLQCNVTLKRTMYAGDARRVGVVRNHPLYRHTWSSRMGQGVRLGVLMGPEGFANPQVKSDDEATGEVRVLWAWVDIIGRAEQLLSAEAVARQALERLDYAGLEALVGR